MTQANASILILAMGISLALSGNAQAESDDKTQLEVIEISMPKPTPSLDLSSTEEETERPRRHCLKNTGTRLRTRGTGRCAVGSGHVVSGNQMQHSGWEGISAAATLRDTTGY